MTPDRELEQKLDSLLAQYRSACPDVEPGANFMPKLWQRIEAKQTFAFSIGRLARGLVTAAVAVCMLLGLFLLSPMAQTSPFYQATYVEVLADDHETLAMADLGNLDPGAENSFIQ